jgi:hypothetical protein
VHLVGFYYKIFLVIYLNTYVRTYISRTSHKNCCIVLKYFREIGNTLLKIPAFRNVTRCKSLHRHCNFREKWHLHLHTQHGDSTFLWKLVGPPGYATSRFGTPSSVFTVATWETQISSIFILQETTGHFRAYLYSGCTCLNLERFAGHRGWGFSLFILSVSAGKGGRSTLIIQSRYSSSVVLV